MGILGKLLGGSGDKKTPRPAREAFPLAQEALNTWSAVKASSARLCCVYTSAEDANRELLRDGRCRGWHFDFYLANEQLFYLVRVVDGKAKGRVRSASGKPVEYIYAFYGSYDREQRFVEPVSLPQDWVDSPAVAKAAFSALEREMADVDRGYLDDYILLSICLAADYVRYLHPEWEPKLLKKLAPSELCYAAIVSHIDVDQHDSLMVYVDATTGTEAAVERFRFPEFMSIGLSADW